MVKCNVIIVAIKVSAGVKGTEERVKKGFIEVTTFD